MRITQCCPCGEKYETTEKRLSQGRGKYCSRSCMYQYRVRPTGLTYEIKKANAGWFQNGAIPHNAGTAKLPELKGRLTGPDHPAWKGDQVGYAALHDWVGRHNTHAPGCEDCGRRDKPLDWANKSGEYRRDRTDWLSLCRRCHRRYDLRRLGRLRCA